MKKTIFIIIGIIVLIIAGLFVYGKFFAKSGSPLNSIANLNTSKKDAGGNYYYSFSGDYLYKIPDGYVVNDVAFPGVQIVVKKGEDLKVKTVDDLYDKGIIAVQPFKPILTDEEAFQNYINNNLKDQVSKSLKGDVTVSFSKKDKVDTAILKTTIDGNLIRYQYIYNSDQPVVVVAKSDDDNFNYVANSVAPIRVKKETSEDYSKLQAAIASTNTLFKTKMIDDLYRSGSKDFQAKISKDSLSQSVSKATTALTANTSTFGAAVSDNEISSSLLFTQVSQDGKNVGSAVGIMTLVKEDGAWKLGGLSLPSNESFVAASPSPTPTPDVIKKK